jgi:peptide/nickel transport system substrate-binding protein
VLVIGQTQYPDTLFGIESNASAASQVLFPTGACITSLGYAFQPTYCFEDDEFATFENGRAVTETVSIDASAISPESPIVISGVLVTDTAVAEDAGLEIPSELPQLKLTWKLNPELRWEDGEPVTSADVLEYRRMTLEPGLNTPDRSIIDRTVNVEATDEHTVVQTMAPGYLDFDYYYNTWALGLGFLPTHLYAGKSLDEIRTAETNKSFSFGPYLVQENVPQEQTTLVSNPYFPQQPKIGTVIFKYLTDENQLLAQLESGEIDYAATQALTLALTPQLTDLENAGKATVQYVPATVWEHIDFGIDRLDDQESFFTDVKTRQAVAYAINRAEIIDKVLYGKTVVMNTYVPSDHPSYPGDSALEPYNYDPEKAKSLLDEAGWTAGADGIRAKDGRSMNLQLYTTEGNTTRQAVSEIIQQNLQDVGIGVEIIFVPGTDVLFKNGADGILAGRKFDLGLYAWLTGPNPSHSLYYCEQIPTEENDYNGNNYPAYCNPEYDAAGKAAEAELDIEAKAELDKAPETIANRDLPTLPLYQRVQIAAFNPAVTGVKIDPTSQIDLYNIQDIDINE